MSRINQSYCRNFLNDQIILMDENSEIGDKNPKLHQKKTTSDFVILYKMCIHIIPRIVERRMCKIDLSYYWLIQNDNF
jgi:hypothetical protein